ncbi:predicted protein [Enterococcus faecium 1,230,933]|nr:predicted protein [Enterococcus faecium 1,230,933]
MLEECFPVEENNPSSSLVVSILFCYALFLTFTPPITKGTIKSNNKQKEYRND